MSVAPETSKLRKATFPSTGRTSKRSRNRSPVTSDRARLSSKVVLPVLRCATIAVDAAQGMMVVTSVMRAHQIRLARVEETLRPWNLSFPRY